MKLVDGMRVRTTKPLDIWGGHWRFLSDKYRTSTYASDLAAAKEEGYHFQLGHSDPVIPANAAGTIRRYERYMVLEERAVPSYVTRIEDASLRKRVRAIWKRTSSTYLAEHIIKAGDDVPEGGTFSWWMWGVEFDDWPTATNTFAGIMAKDEWPDWLEVVE